MKVCPLAWVTKRMTEFVVTRKGRWSPDQRKKEKDYGQDDCDSF
jgi:hypothetical protein